MSSASADSEPAPRGHTGTNSDSTEALAGADGPRLQQWALPLALLFSVLFWILAWHGDAAAGMARTWWQSDTFAHGMIIYPMSAWLVWRKRVELAALPVTPCLWALGPLALAAFMALLGDLGGVEAARQFGLVAMIPLAVVTILGVRVARAIAFPLAFTVLAVPVGEFLLPILMQHTADFTVTALRLSGIPVYREGLFFTLPTGRWSVVEACSGLRYLIASVTLGLLYAYLSYTSWWRRALFVAAAAVVPIVANWLRAYMIVMIGHVSGMQYAVGVDHLVYGWVFFGIVMLVLFWVGSWWREDHREVPETGARPAGKAGGVSAAIVLGTLAVALVASAGPLYLQFLDSHEHASTRSLPQPEAAGDWLAVSPAEPLFHPHFLNARSTTHQSYEKNGRRVGMFVGYYARQREGGELIAFGNDLVNTSDHTWRRVSERRQRASAGRGPDVIETRLHSDRGPLLVWHWYWAGGRWSVHPEEVKVRQALDRLLGRGDDAAVVVLYLQPTASANDDSAAILQQFVAAMEPSIRAALEAARPGDSPRGFAAALLDR